MAGSLNKVILIGNLGRDPEIRHGGDGSRIGNLSLATSETWKDKATGERKERTEWHRIVIFNDNLVDIAEKYLRKGSKILVEGQLQTRKWTDQNGIEKYVTEVVLSRFKGEITMLDSRGGEGDAFISSSERNGPLPSGGQAPNRPMHISAPQQPPVDDDIPF